MKNIFLLFAITIFLSTGTVYASNITIPDNNYDDENNTTGWYGTQEDDEVEPDMVQNQIWDLEGFFLEDKKLSLVGGYDFKKGIAPYYSGDIFIDIDNNAVYGGLGDSSENNTTVNKTYGYDYAIDLYWTGNIFSYNVFKLNSETFLQTAYYSQNQGSSPWRYISGGNQILNGVTGQYNTDTSNYDYTFSPDNIHNELIVDIGFLSGIGNTDFIAHYTMGCGNDNIMGRAPIPNPEPATMILLGFGLIGIAGICRRKL